ncbi:MAG: SIR2 family protein [Candidatus Binatia bacterium]
MERLRQVLSQDDTVLFVGSGISVWSGLPSWPRFIEELASFVEATGAKADLIRAEARKGDLLQAASYGFDKLTKHQIGEFIRGACRYGIAKPHEVHRRIVSLGPRCFVTTNYDNLIEESLRIWQPGRFFRPPVTNRHLTETAEIVHARAVDFVFKPHGDAADSDSIVLTREQYRQLLPAGERQAALESVKMLLASRPVVYLGFGLRDPDFMYVRDLLANTYKGGTRDHYAVMADVSDAEVDYWRRNYGIHLVGYATTEQADKSRDHGALMVLLDRYLTAPPVATANVTAIADEPCTPEIVLALARHAGRLTRFAKVDHEFPIRMHLEEDGRQKRQFDYQHDEFDHCPVEQFLEEGPERALLIGLPGSGKTYSLHRAAARLAERLHDTCLSEPFDEGRAVVPILADLKLYRGDLHALVDRTLPNGLSLGALAERFKLKIFLDSFNEMPREYWESGSYEAEFTQFIGTISHASFIIGSRSSDGLSKLGFPSYGLDQVDETFVAAELQRLKIDIGGRFEREVRRLLQKPFYFQLVANRAVSLPKDPHPRDFYQTFFSELARSFEERFGRCFNLEGALSLAAYEAIDRREEAQPLADLLQVLKAELQGAGIDEIHAQDVANWLVSRSVIIPYTGARVAFFHQSATEYLAAGELARRYQASPHIVKEKLSLTRWDQALFLTLSLLPPDGGAAFLQAVIEADFALALNATKYVEAGRDEVVAKLLSQVPRRIAGFDPFEFKIMNALEFGVPVAEVHEPELRAIMRCGELIAAAAVKRLVQLKGATVKDELLQSLIERRADYNYCCNGIAAALTPFITVDDVRNFVAMADIVQQQVSPEDDEDATNGFTSAIATLLTEIDLSVIKDAFIPNSAASLLSDVRAAILCKLLRKHHSTAAINLAGDLLLHGIKQAAFTIYFSAHFGKPEHEVSWASFGNSHVEKLVSMIGDDDEDWGLRALKCLCEARSDIAASVKERALNESGLRKMGLLHCASSEDKARAFESLAELATMSEEQRRDEPTHLLKQIELEWAGHETLLVQLLKLRDVKLAFALFGGFFPDRAPGELEIGPIEWWLEWLRDEKDSDLRWWLQERISWLFSRCLKPEAREAFVAEFNNPGSEFRTVLARSILLARSDLTTDNFSEDAVSFLLADLNREGSANLLRGHLLGAAATETFVTERLLPLLPEAKEHLLKNLQKVLRQAGSRHGRRYIAE